MDERAEAYLVKAVDKRTALSDNRFNSTNTFQEAFTKATEREMNSMEKNMVFGEPIEFKEVSKHNEAQFVHGHFVYVIKNYEMEEDESKVRLVAAGNNVRSKDNLQVSDEGFAPAPVSLEACRALIVTATIKRHDVEVADLTTAYVQAELHGPVTYIRTPKEARPKEWGDKFHDPVQRLNRALYGLKRAGGDWDRHSADELEDIGWIALEDVERRLFFKANKAMGAYIDDLIVSAAPGTLAEEWRQIGRIFEVKEIKPLDKFVGISYNRYDGNKGIIIISMHQHEMIDQLLGKFGDELSCVTNGELKESNIPGTSELTMGDCDMSVFGATCKKWIGSLLFIARGSRPDITFSVAYVARYLDKWTAECDKKLIQIFGYLKATKGYQLNGISGNESVEQLWVELFSDADYAGDKDSRKSTTGWIIRIKGLSTNLPLAWGSKKQTAIARSSAESELIALHEAVRQLIPIHEVLKKLLGSKIKARIYTDSKATFDIIRNGYSRKLNYMKKTQGVSIGWLSQELSKDEYEVKLVRSEDNLADLFTKPLPKKTLEKILPIVGFRT